MLSWPEFTRDEPAGTTAVATVPTGAALPSASTVFVADHPALPTAVTPSFEVASGSGVPDAVLGPARRAAASAGYAAGWAHGLAAARRISDAEITAARTRADDETRAVRARVDTALRALSGAAADYATRSAATLDDAQDALLTAAYELAESIVGACVRDDAVRGRAALDRALAAVAPDATAVTVALHPSDHAFVTATGSRLPTGVTLVADPSLALGDAVATAGDTAVDARIATALARVREVLGL